MELAIAIPRAWTDVRMDASPQAKILARGVDAAGRIQRIYAPWYVAQQAERKFARVAKLAARARKAVAQARRDLGSPDGAMAQHAAALLLIAATGMRPGSARDTRARVRAYGATTLERRHIAVSGAEIRYDFVGKKGVRIVGALQDRDIARYLGRRGAGQLFPAVSDGSLRSYLGAAGGHGLLVKDLRTIIANDVARAEIRSTRAHICSNVPHRRLEMPTALPDSYLTTDPADAVAFARKVQRVSLERILYGCTPPSRILGHPDAEGVWIVPLPGVRWPRIGTRYAEHILGTHVRGGWCVIDPAEVEEFAA